MKKIHPLILAGSSGLLLYAAWPVLPFTFLIFFAFIPLLWLEQQSTRGAKFFGWTYLTMLIWNVATTWWVCNSTLIGGMAAMLANSLLMCLPWICFYHIKRALGPKFGYPSLLFFWLSFEYIHLNWELSWPWLTVGNVFATHPGWVQWYEFTGCSGGSLWVLLMNLTVFLLLRAAFNGGDGKRGATRTPPGRLGRSVTRYALYALLVLAGPIIFSRLLATNIEEQTTATDQATPNVIIVQPTLDPYNEKCVDSTQEGQLARMISLSESQIDLHTALIVWPETAVPKDINEDEMKLHPFMAPIWAMLSRHPGLSLLTGVEGFRVYPEQDKTPTSIKVPGTDLYEDSYNSAALLDSHGIRIYHKSRLVPGVETLPSFLRFMRPLFEKFGGTGSGYAGQEERTVLHSANGGYHIAPAVCYESIYGEFLSAYIRNGADLIAVITNDGWWGNTAGYKQHENYARLRAIEDRRWVVRSANTGISCFIDPAGRVIDPQPWDKVAVIKMPVPPNKGLTLYARYGDILFKLALPCSILVVIWGVFVTFKRRLSHG
ncbi:MAG: apolipoprotein N-acyltransferase [Bacteroidota bacterium]|nr:apolipoprotein N-acyltransferase [Bacteroidota bacterium]